MSTAVVKTKEKPLFVKSVHELSALFKLVQAESRDAIEVVIETMGADVKEVGHKVKFEAAKFILEFQAKLQDQISKDELTRQIAEIKVNGLKTPLELEEGKELPPTLDLMTIQKV